MVDPARRRSTYEDVLRAPAHHVAEVLDGELHVSPRPAPRHTMTASALGMDLGVRFQFGRKGPGQRDAEGRAFRRG